MNEQACVGDVTQQEILEEQQTHSDVETAEVLEDVQHVEEIESDASHQEENIDTQVAQEQETIDYKDKFLRLQAEWDNYRKRTAEQAQQTKLRALKDITKELIGIIDDIERAIDHAQKQSQENNELAQFAQGVCSIQTKLLNVLESKAEVQAINPKEGDAFDVMLHQAVSTCEHAEFPEDSIGAVYQKGYQMGQDVLRPAMVVVTTKPTEQADE